MAVPTTAQRAKSAPAVAEERSAARQDFKDHIREAAAEYRDRLIAAAPPTTTAQTLSDKQERRAAVRP